MENETTPAYFIQVPLDMLSSYDLTPTDYLVFGQIYTMLNVTQKCFMSNANMGKKLGIKANTVQKSVSKMKKLGLIETSLIYKEGSKEVDKRFITLTPRDVYHHPHGRQSPTPRDENHGGGGRESTDNRLLNRLDEYKEDEEEVTAINVFIDNWKQEPNPIFKSKLVDLVSTYSDEFISECLKVAAESNVKLQSLSAYLDSLIKDLDKNKVTKAEKIKGHVENHRKLSKTKKQGRSGHRRVETLPDWAKDDYKPKEYKQSNKYSRDELKKKIANLQNKRNDNNSNQNDGIKDYTREELEERLNKFKEKRNNE